MKQIERIRNMNAEEMAELFIKHPTCKMCIFNQLNNNHMGICKKGIIKWLESEVEE